MRRLPWVIVAGCSAAAPKTAPSTPTPRGGETVAAQKADDTTTPVEQRERGGGSAASGEPAGAKHARVPTVAISEPMVGSPDKAVIRRYIKRVTTKLQDCYDKQALVDPKLEGTVTVAFTIAPDGSVSAATGSGLEANVDRCVADVIKQIQFPQPRGGGSMQVSYPFVFRH